MPGYGSSMLLGGMLGTALLWGSVPVAGAGETDPLQQVQPAAEVGAAFEPEVQRQIESLIKGLASKDLWVRQRAEWGLANFGPAVRPLLEPQARGADAEVAKASARILARKALNLQLPRARIRLREGTIEVILFQPDAPRTVERFLQLSERRFYDGLRFHRVIERFLVQGGDPTNTGRGGPGYRFEDEIAPGALGLDRLKVKDLVEQLKSSRPAPRGSAEWTLKELYERQGYSWVEGLESHVHLRGSMAMANSGPHTNGSQFFITHLDCPWLDGKHTVFGQVVRGLALVDGMVRNERILALEQVAEDPAGKVPTEPISRETRP